MRQTFIILSIATLFTTVALADGTATPPPATTPPPAADAKAGATTPAATAAVEVKVAGPQDCSKSPSLKVSGAKLKITLSGACTAVEVTGADNEIAGDSVVTLTVAGNGNKIALSKVDAVNVKGNKNEVTYTGTVDATKTAGPAIDNKGKDNKVASLGATAVDAAAKAAKDPKKATKDADKAAKDAAKAAAKIPGLGK